MNIISVELLQFQYVYIVFHHVSVYKHILQNESL